jgi:ubiquinone/menaquinone biosynthesis C-methylase UbiE
VQPSDALFDAYEDTYRETVQDAIAFSGQSHEYFTRAKVRELLHELRRIGDPSHLRVLDVGCGVGETDALLAAEVRELHGVDVSEGSIRRAREANPGVEYRSYAGERLPYGDATHDAAFAICVMHHVPPAEWPAFMAEMARVVRPGGLVCVFEHNPLNPLTRRVVANCAFDEDAVLLSRRRVGALARGAGLHDVRARDILFLPFGGDRLAGVERALGRIPLGAQHCVAARVGG